MPGQLLVDEPADGVVRLTLSNPQKRNALDHAILDGLAAAVDTHGGARCLILTGAHGMFSAGYDIGDIPDDVFTEYSTMGGNTLRPPPSAFPNAGGRTKPPRGNQRREYSTRPHRRVQSFGPKPTEKPAIGMPIHLAASR